MVILTTFTVNVSKGLAPYVARSAIAADEVRRLVWTARSECVVEIDMFFPEKNALKNTQKIPQNIVPK